MSRHLKNWLDAYLAYMEFSEAPKHFHFWAGIAAVAGALRRKVYIDQIYFRWSPNFYIIFVAPSGIATKSTAMDAAMDILKEVQSIYFGPNTMTWQALIQDLGRAQEHVLIPGGEYETQSCLTFASRELGSLLDPRDRKLLDVLVDLWDGKTDAWRKATQTYGDQIAINPWLNIAACTTPSWIADNMPRHVIGGGFTSRCLFVYGDKKEKFIAYPKKIAEERKGLEWVAKLRQDLVHDLEEISLISGEYHIEKEAEEFGEPWYEDIYKRPARHLLVHNFDGYLARKQSHVHRVAMVIAASYTDERRITLDDLQTAIALVEDLETDMVKVFSHIGKDEAANRTEEVLRIIRIHRSLSYSQFFRLVYAKLAMQKREFEEIVTAACEAGVIKQGANLVFTLVSDNLTSTDDKEEHTDLPEEDPIPLAVDS